MSRRPPALLFTIVALASCLLGYWLLTPREDKVAPAPWLQQWDIEVLRPLLEDRLSVGDLSQRLSAAELWLQPRMDGPRLLLRGELDGWRVEGELALSDAQRASLADASGVRPNDPEQPQSAEMLAQLAGRNIEGLNLLPQQLVSATTLSASLGEPRLRLQLQEGEAWVYPQQGLTAHIQDERVQLLRAVPKRLLQH
ncbi:hypothetical protein [Pseudomonas sp. Gutcm_11s]|uniref:hypothetical protein n=1 Tax=Pseudomonas sp. Gutcm_11s TaxID=3026088 RepID=UPI00235F11C4|nr:hypothetical protein [Pseudomonas sp. Gutcm_11s]MDD0842238.1 hypothetical protein [Pseudomonas sp. Gutcm_11s]